MRLTVSMLHDVAPVLPDQCLNSMQIIWMTSRTALSRAGSKGLYQSIVETSEDQRLREGVRLIMVLPRFRSRAHMTAHAGLSPYVMACHGTAAPFGNGAVRPEMQSDPAQRSFEGQQPCTCTAFYVISCTRSC